MTFSSESLNKRVGVIPLLLLICLLLFSHASYLPPGYLAALFLIAVPGVFIERVRTLTRYLVIGVGLSVFIAFFRSNFSVEMAGAFLLLAALFKLYELRQTRDLHSFIFVSIYTSAVSFLFAQNFLHTLVQLLIVGLCLYCLLRIYGGSNWRIGVDWSALFKVGAFAVPFVVVCFLFFPRLDPLWSIPVKTSYAKTGMGDAMSPGDIERLSQSSERAFRVQFHGNRLPTPEQRYWRGVVLDQFDGRVWTRSAKRGFTGSEKFDTGRFITRPGADTYEVMLEPHFQYWAFALLGSQAQSTNLRSADMGLLELDSEAIQATRYLLSWRPELGQGAAQLPSSLRLPGVQVIRGVERGGAAPRPYQDVQVPGGSNPRTRAWLAQMQQAAASETELVAALLRHFKDDAYFYTLEPPLLGADYVDEFLFDAKRGFCAHYAGSLAFMLRLADIPARVVMGYQGGEFNPDGGYFIIHQFDAHAWVEAYLDGIGWVQLDPTALIAPDRIQSGLVSALREEGSFLSDSPLASAAHQFGVLSWMRLRLDQMNYQWQKWVVNYNPDQQDSLVTALYGQFGKKHLSIIFVSLIFAVVFGAFWWLSHQQQSLHLTPAARSYRRWCWWLARFGYVRQEHETPRAFLARVEQGGQPRLIRLTQRLTERLERQDYQR